MLKNRITWCIYIVTRPHFRYTPLKCIISHFTTFILTLRHPQIGSHECFHCCRVQSLQPLANWTPTPLPPSPPMNLTGKWLRLHGCLVSICIMTLHNGQEPVRRQVSMVSFVNYKHLIINTEQRFHFKTNVFKGVRSCIDIICAVSPLH